jgi:hypothetical protein
MLIGAKDDYEVKDAVALAHDQSQRQLSVVVNAGWGRVKRTTQSLEYQRTRSKLKARDREAIGSLPMTKKES